MRVSQKFVFLHHGMLLAHMDSHDPSILHAQDALSDLSNHILKILVHNLSITQRPMQACKTILNKKLLLGNKRCVDCYSS